MEWHRRTFEVFGPAGLELDHERGAAVERAAAEAGVGLPRAVVEWYSIPESLPLWSWYCLPGDCLAMKQPPGERADWWDRAFVGDGSLIRDERRGGWWVIPALRSDARGWVKGAILPLLYGAQGCWWSGVILDGTDDPPVVLCDGDQGDAWDYHAASFSEYVFAQVFDGSMALPPDAGRAVSVAECLSPQQLLGLREQFRPEPTLRYEGGLFKQHFSRPGQRFSVLNVPAGYSEWVLWGAGPAEFAELLRTLSRVCKSLEGLSQHGPRLCVPQGRTAEEMERGDRRPPAGFLAHRLQQGRTAQDTEGGDPLPF